MRAEWPEKPGFIGLHDAPQHPRSQRRSTSVCGEWRTAESHLYIEAEASEFRSRSTVHRALKKSDFFVFFAFDLPERRTYNQRPRCFAADVAKRVLPLNLDAKIV